MHEVTHPTLLEHRSVSDNFEFYSFQIKPIRILVQNNYLWLHIDPNKNMPTLTFSYSERKFCWLMSYIVFLQITQCIMGRAPAKTTNFLSRFARSSFQGTMCLYINTYTVITICYQENIKLTVRDESRIKLMIVHFRKKWNRLLKIMMFKTQMKKYIRNINKP